MGFQESFRKPKKKKKKRTKSKRRIHRRDSIYEEIGTSVKF